MNTKRIYLLVIVFLIGLFAPTSINSIINPYLPVVYSTFTIIIYLVYIVKGAGIPIIGGLLALMINGSLWMFTLLTPLTTFAYGNAVYYLLFSLMICLNIKGEKFKLEKFNIMNIVHLVNLLLCFFVIIQNQTIVDFFINNYSMYYPEMMVNAMYYKKPVIMFAAHSIAGLFLFLFFYISFSEYKEKKKLKNLIFSLMYVFFMFSLNSNGGYVFFALAILQLVIFLLKERKRMSLFICLIATIFSLILFEELQTNITQVFMTITSDTNGILGRYSDNGILKGNFTYMTENPFSPTGFGNDTELFFGDSGLIEYMVRGSFLLAVCMYLGLFIFLRRNLLSKKSAYFLLIAIFIMDIGSITLLSFRTLLMLPLLIIYLNALKSKEPSSVGKIKKLSRKKFRMKFT